MGLGLDERAKSSLSSSESILIWILYAVIRTAPRRWWFYFWLVSLPLLVLLSSSSHWSSTRSFINSSRSLRKIPALTISLEKMVQRAGQEIPPERMFWMNAGEKTQPA